MIRWKNDAGAGKLGTIIALLLIVLVIYLALMFVPVRVDSYAFKDAMTEQAKFASSKSDAQILNALVLEGSQLGLPVGPENIDIRRSAGRITISATYTVEVETIFFTYPWKFEQKVHRELF